MGFTKVLFTAAAYAGLALSVPSWPSHGPESFSHSHEYHNGASTWGTLKERGLAHFIDGPTPYGSPFPWGNCTANNTNAYELGDVPYTGVTRSYTWTVTNTTLAPDGVEVSMLVVNGAFPGPLIEANWGDWIEVTVINGLPLEGTAIHWHGFLQTGTPYEDGVPGVTQCPIAPGKSFTYRFRAELYGTSWWHSHFSAQYIDGLVGPIVVHGPTTSPYDIDLGPIMLTDWFHTYYMELLEQVFYATPVGPIFPPMAVNMLIQGKNDYNCSNTNHTCTPNAPKSQFRFQSGKKHLLRLINHSAEAIIFFSIDGYSLTVISNDFVPLVPYTVDYVTLAVGQRTEVVVEAIGQPTDSVWLRITQGLTGLSLTGAATGCSLNDGLSFEATAAIYYEDADTSIPPNTTTSVATSNYLFPAACNNSPLNVTVPAFAIPVTEPDITIPILMTSTYNSTGAFVWLMNNVTYYADLSDPTLFEAELSNLVFPPERQVYNTGNHTSVRLVMTSVGFPASHPMHIHGHNMQILAYGVGEWDNTTIINPENPQRRDVQLIGPNGFLVVQFDLNNPGAWPFHCHVAWHTSEGMNIIILENPEAIEADVALPYVMAQTCRDWAAFTDTHVVNVIDSGL